MIEESMDDVDTNAQSDEQEGDTKIDDIVDWFYGEWRDTIQCQAKHLAQSVFRSTSFTFADAVVNSCRLESNRRDETTQIEVTFLISREYL